MPRDGAAIAPTSLMVCEGRRRLVLYAVAAAIIIHGLLLWFLLAKPSSQLLPQPKQRIEVNLVAPTPTPTPVVPVAVTTPPTPPKVRPVVAPSPKPHPLPVAHSASPSERVVEQGSKSIPISEPNLLPPVPAAVTLAEQPEPTPVPPQASELKPETVSAPGFNAAYLNNPKPVYPASARRMGLEGLVILRVKVDSHGKPQDVQVLISSGSSILDKSALDVVSQQWTFVPARQGERPVSGVVDVPVRFSLR